jgi:hypothetical protein
MGKKKVLISIDEELLLELRKAAVQKYGYLKGSLSKAIEDAIRNYLMAGDPPFLHTHTQHKNLHKNLNVVSSSTNRNVLIIQKIINYLKNDGIEFEFPLAIWKQACIKAGFNDNRTMMKYLDLAIKLNYIENTTVGLFRLKK